MFKDDEQLVQALVAGDARAFGRFMDLYAQRLAAFVRRRVAADGASIEDIVQNSLIRAVRALHQYRGEASLYTWLCQIACSEMLDERRRLRRRIPAVSLDVEGIAGMVAALPDPTDYPGGLPAATENPTTDAVITTLARIPLRYARVLEWKYGDEASVEDISGLLGIGVTAAQSLLARARAAFREAWLAQGEKPGALSLARARSLS